MQEVLVLNCFCAAYANQPAYDLDIAAEIKEQHKRLLSWADIFETASLEEKKMIASYMIKAVTISRDYNLKVDFNISEAQYLDGMSMGQGRA